MDDFYQLPTLLAGNGILCTVTQPAAAAKGAHRIIRNSKLLADFYITDAL